MVGKNLRSEPRHVLLTFDVEGQLRKEDFFDETSLMCLQKVLGLLEENDFKGIFFITGSATEQIQRYPHIVELLSRHEIGYHSSSHTVRPRIFEYTDVENYEEAVEISFKRETSHINPETGQIEGEGGILALRKTFPQKRVICFRAPFLAWSPPHLEALRKLGIMYDFSSDISTSPLSFRGITFYPSPISIDGVEATVVHRGQEDFFPKPLFSIFLKRVVTVLFTHPARLFEKPSTRKVENAFTENVRARLALPFFQLFLDQLRFLQEANLIQVTASPSKNWQPLNMRDLNVERIYRASVRAPIRLFDTNPQFVRSHFLHFFGQEKSESRQVAC